MIFFYPSQNDESKEGETSYVGTKGGGSSSHDGLNGDKIEALAKADGSNEDDRKLKRKLCLTAAISVLPVCTRSIVKGKVEEYHKKCTDELKVYDNHNAENSSPPTGLERIEKVRDIWFKNLSNPNKSPVLFGFKSNFELLSGLTTLDSQRPTQKDINEYNDAIKGFDDQINDPNTNKKALNKANKAKDKRVQNWGRVQQEVADLEDSVWKWNPQNARESWLLMLTTSYKDYASGAMKDLPIEHADDEQMFINTIAMVLPSDHQAYQYIKHNKDHTKGGVVRRGRNAVAHGEPLDDAGVHLYIQSTMDFLVALGVDESTWKDELEMYLRGELTELSKLEDKIAQMNITLKRWKDEEMSDEVKQRKRREAIARLHPQQEFLYGVRKTGGYLDEKRGKRDGENLGGLKEYRFAGRKWLFEDVRKWMEDENGKQTMVLLASAGFGKSAFAAQLVEEEMKDDVVAFHFCSNERNSNLNPRKFINGLVVSLAKNVEGFTVKLLKLVELQMESGEEGEPLFDQGSLDHFNKFVDDKEKEPQDIIQDYVLEALSCVKRPAKGKVKLIVIDSLDEAALLQGKEHNILDLVAEMAESDKFPKWLKLLVTSRDQTNVTDKFKYAKTIDLKVELNEKEHKENNEEDMRLYLKDRIGFDVIPPERYRMQQALEIVNQNGWKSADTLGEFVEAIVEKSEGMFLYAVYIVDAIENGEVSLDQSVEDFKKCLPGGIYQFYEERFQKVFTDDDHYADKVTPVLEIIAAAREPIPLDVLSKACGLETKPLRGVLKEVTSFCKDGGEPFTFVHQSFVDWILNEHEKKDNHDFKVDKESGDTAIKRVLLMKMGEGWKSRGTWKGWESEYFSRQGSRHLKDAVREWRENKVEAEKKYGGIEDWDLSEVTSFSLLFRGAKEFNSDLSTWNTSNCTNMYSMFNGCSAFNSDLSKWNTSKCTNMSFMFYGCSAFNSDLSDLSKWNTSNCTSMRDMFNGCSAFNSNLSTWNTSNCTNMCGMFYGCSAFNSDLSMWDTSNCTNMYSMFRGCSAFNSDLSKWSTSNCTNMRSMFHDCSAFNSDISTWNTSNCTNMKCMFKNATSFDSNLSQWNMSKVEYKNEMFIKATAMKASHKPKGV